MHLQQSGNRLHYEVTGDGPVIAFSHGVLMDATMWSAQVKELSKDFTCLVWDERGHGRTVFDGRAFDYWDSAKDLLRLLDDIGADQAVLVGHSQGGFLSLRAALTAPERVSGLVLAPSHGQALDAGTRTAFEQVKAAWQAEGPGPVQDTLLQMLVGEPALYGPLVQLWERMDRTAIGPLFDALINVDDLGDRLATIDVPSLVVHGGADPAMPLALGQDLHDRLGGSVGLHVVEGAGHSPSLTHPRAFNAALLPFVTACTSRTGVHHG